MKIHLCDRECSSRELSSWHKALLIAFPVEFQSNSTCDANEPPEDHAAYKDSTAILFCHSSLEADWRNQAGKSSCQVVLVRSGGQQGKESNAKGNLHGCYWHPDDFKETKGTPRPARLQSWIDQVKSGTTASIQWSLLQPAATESLWALRLLCEGFLSSDHTQDIPDNWFELLGPGLPPNEIVSKLSDNASELSPDHQAPKAMTGFLTRMSQEGNPKDPSDVTECLLALNSLLGIGA
jgi:hypothetical protein